MFLTRRQSQVLEFVRDRVRATGFAPTLAEIGDHLGLRSPATVYKHVQHLVRKGYLRKFPHQGRGIEPVEHPPARAVEVPVFGAVSAGNPIEPLPRGEAVAIPPTLVGRRPTFALRARDSSLISAAVLHGDLLILEDRDDAGDGDTVIAVSGSNAVALGIVGREEGRRILRVGDPRGHPRLLPLENLRIRGVVVGLLRTYAQSIAPALEAESESDPPRSAR